MSGESFRTSPFLPGLLCLALAACGAALPPEVATSEQAHSAAEAGAQCDQGDIQCEERIYLLQETLSMYEAGVAATTSTAAQACWRADVDSARRSLGGCNDIACQQKALLERIASLHQLQPAERRAAIDLPQVPLLVAVIGPEPGAWPPATESGTPVALAARGQLVHALDAPRHMGMAVRTESGQEHVFITDADLGRQPVHQELQELLANSPTAQVLVRGSSTKEDDGVANFDASSCRLVYQLQ